MIRRLSTLLMLLALVALLASGCTGVKAGFLTRGTAGMTAVLAAAEAPAPPDAEPPDAEQMDAPFSTPEAAMRHYIDGVRRNDVDAIAAACAIEEMAHGFQFEQQTERLGMMNPLLLPLPPDYPFYAALNAADQRAQCLRYARMLALSLLSTEAFDGRPILDPGAERVAQFVRDIDPQRLSGLALERTGAAPMIEDARYLENAARQARIYSADELTERVGLLSFEQGHYLIGFTLLRYGDEWKIMSQVANLAGTSALGTVGAIAPESFNAYLITDEQP